jgi:hypothetical protein
VSDTALNGTEPVLDLDAMLEDLHNDFQGDIPIGGGEQAESGDASEGNEEDSPVGASEDGSASPDPGLDQVLPPGYVQFGEEVLPEIEVKALLQLNQRVRPIQTSPVGSKPPLRGLQPRLKPPMTRRICRPG